MGQKDDKSLSKESENILVGDGCSCWSLDSLGKDKCVSVLGGLIQPTPACKYTNSPAWNKNTKWIMAYLPPRDLLMLLDADLSLNRRCLTFNFPPKTHFITSSPEISKFNPLFPSSLIPADRGLGTTSTWGLVGPISLCNAFHLHGYACTRVAIYNCVWCKVSDLACMR